jgi:hypothetical protein
MRHNKHGSHGLPGFAPGGNQLIGMEDRDIWAAAAEAEEEDTLGEAVFALDKHLAAASDRAAALVKLARTFPSLDAAAGLDPWSPDVFEAWMLSDECSVSGYWSALLVLNLWEREPASFDPREATAGWDALDRQTFDRLSAQAHRL